MTTIAAPLPAPAPASRLPEFRIRLGDAVFALAATVVAMAAWMLPEGLDFEGRGTLAITGVAILGWTLSRIPDAIIAVLAAVALVVLGAVPKDALGDAFGHPMILLMLGAFVVAAVVTASGLAERVAMTATRPFRTVRGLFYGIAGVIFATAFIIPSTSARAALLLPVFLALVGRLPDARLSRALALLFPTLILLSAGASLIGAGAHVVAADVISRAQDAPMDMLRWAALAAPYALVSSVLAVELILRLFTTAEIRRLPIGRPAAAPGAVTGRQAVQAIIVLAVVALWVTAPWHGIEASVIALLGAAILLPKAISGLKTKDAFRKVDVELLVFLAATMTLAQAMRMTGVDAWAAEHLLALTPEHLRSNLTVAVVIAAVVATMFHLMVNSRSARAVVLIPALGIPLAGLGHDPALLALVIVLGTGFCQTLPASAKPLAVFASVEKGGFTRSDLLRLAAVLGPCLCALLIAFGLWVWPAQMNIAPVDVVPPSDSLASSFEAATRHA